jgi:zinc transporter ZupT
LATIAMMSVLAGLASVVGGGVTLWFTLSQERMQQLMALGAGFLVGGALFAMLPGALHADPHGAVYVALGYLGLYAIRSITAGGRHHGAGPAEASAWAALAGLLLHSLFDGAALGVAARADRELGMMAFTAIFLHKLPEGFSLATVVLSATGSRRLALAGAGAVGLATVAGAVLAGAWAASSHLSVGALMGIAAGSFLYIGTAEMLPSVVRTGPHTWLVLVGASMVFLLSGGHVH